MLAVIIERTITDAQIGIMVSFAVLTFGTLLSTILYLDKKLRLSVDQNEALVEVLIELASKKKLNNIKKLKDEKDSI